MDEIGFKFQELPMGDTIWWITINGENLQSLWIRKNNLFGLYALIYRNDLLVQDYDFSLIKYLLIEHYYRLLETSKYATNIFSI